MERMGGGGGLKRKKVVIDRTTNNLICYQPKHVHVHLTPCKGYKAVLV